MFSNKNNLFHYNYFLIKNYRFIFYFLFKLKNFEFLTPKLNNYLHDYSDFSVKNNLDNKYTRRNVLKKLNNYFIIFYKNTKFINHHSYQLVFNTNNVFINRNFINFFYSLTFNKTNFIMLDSDYSHIYPLYKFMYGVNTLQIYKNFFF